MIENYMNNFNALFSNALFFCFKYTVIFLTIVLLLSLIIFAIGCLVKSQMIKSKFLRVIPTLITIEILVLTIPLMVVRIKNLI